MIHYSEKLPAFSELHNLFKGRTPFVLYDQNLLRYGDTANWLSDFKNGFSLYSGEELKNIKHWPHFLETFLPHTRGLSASEILLIAVGGGSVGDFTGFLASVLKRGVSLWHFPTTWLSAMDSAHGGKTAMNVGNVKNQIGTFYQAEEVFISKNVLDTQPEDIKLAAFGELIKIAILDSEEFVAKLPNTDFWSLLPKAIEAKLKFVEQDPYERRGIRQNLNLGHTLGHALELHHGLPHGRAVLLGLKFAIEWSKNRKFLSVSDARKLEKLFQDIEVPKYKILRGKLRDSILHDKKSTSGDQVQFVFVKGLGETFVEKVKINDLLTEADRQGWVS